MTTCTQCSLDLPDTDYYSDNRKKNGLASCCKRCQLAIVSRSRAGKSPRAIKQAKEEALQALVKHFVRLSPEHQTAVRAMRDTRKTLGLADVTVEELVALGFTPSK